MKAAYPVSHDVETLPPNLAALKIARHSDCSLCECGGLTPDPDTEVVLDTSWREAASDDLELYGPDAEDILVPLYIDTCSCGHSVFDHNADYNQMDSADFVRRTRVAVRIDELLQDVGKLLDFDYQDDDTISLRRQLNQSFASISRPSPDGLSQLLPSSPESSSVLSPPPSKRRKLSNSSLSNGDDDEDEDDEDDEPLATRMTQAVGGWASKSSRGVPSHRGAAKGTGKKTKARHISPTTVIPTGMLNSINGIRPKTMKVEEKLDEQQLNRLATGVALDTGNLAAPPPPKVEKAATIELRKGIIQITSVENDRQPRSLIILTGLKTLFQKQLPKMPREYIARLVLDSNSKALAIIKRGYKVVGGICYRPFPHRGFAEIVFFATASVDQVKGYGGMLMDHFKTHIRKTYPEMMHFLTYADNYAVGYFEKQGFSKEITLDRAVWAGYIKDYEGGTIMQCTMLRKVDYLDKANILGQQQDAILTKIRQMSRSHIIYPGLPQFQDSTATDISVDYTEVPGLRETGWTPDTVPLPRAIPRNPDHQFMEKALHELINHPLSWAFIEPVNADDVPDYYQVIKNPMTFKTMEQKLESNQYDTIESFASDAKLVFDNARLYNEDGTIYHKNANRLEQTLHSILANRFKG